MYKKLGILGAGQLAQLLAHRAYQLGIDVICFADSNNYPAAKFAKIFIGDLENPQDLADFARQVEVITLENENIEISTLNILKENLPKNINMFNFPSIKAVVCSQDRLLEKKLFIKLGIKTANFLPINNLDDLNYHKNKQLSDINNGILKTRRFGYDGKGQVGWSKDEFVDNDDGYEGDIKNTAMLGYITNIWGEIGQQPAILEQKVDFALEVSQISARSVTGEIVHYPLIENLHKNGILYTSECPAKSDLITKRQVEAAQEYMTKLLLDFDYVGVLALELFVLPNGELLANECAPRVHNSGHLTNEAFTCGQFEMHLRCVCGSSISHPKLIVGDNLYSSYKMHNIIGEISSDDKNIASQDGVYLYDYLKSARVGRKLGHIVICK